MNKLDKEFYTRDTIEAAHVLLGKIVVSNTPDGVISGRIVETEAYVYGDPAAHTTKWRTPRTEVMFGEPGRAYIYFIHGLHYCMNVVSHPVDVPGGVLLRALEPLEGIDLMRKNRGRQEMVDLCSGPAKLTQALQIDISLLGEDLLGDRLYLVDDGTDVGEIIARPRIGVSLAVDKLLRFYPSQYSHWVSKR
ncbi:MAG: DNA-3-methyladenine glycosylase [Armatimonadetes bacterium]|jgi:DNA-3-methyladenine glycosylase|nr:DNA-3-methyladenine glycosylase [Armatimonadota bacterium]